ncbi:uncharacterized protein LOC143933097 [Lithobates pipiens]
MDFTAVLGTLFILFTFGNTANDYCVSFNCTDFLGHMLIIKKENVAETYCTLEQNIKVGDTVTCPSGANATVINSSCVLLKTQETLDFLMEYGIDNKIHGDVCRSIKAVCPKTDHPKTDHPKTDHPKTDHPKTNHPKTENKENNYWYLLLLIVFFVPLIIYIVAVIR